MKRKPLNNKTICPFPFEQVSYAMDGRIGPCTNCTVIENFTSLEEYWNSDSLQKLREDMFNGIRNPICKECHEREDAGAWNFREYLVESNPDYEYNIEDPSVKTILFRFSNLCNFRCIDCVWNTSSSIYAEEMRRGNLEKQNPIIYPGGDASLALEEAKKHYKTFQNIGFSGGEPLLHWQMWDMLNFLIENKRYPSLSYYTNGSKLEFKKQKITDLWKQFKNVELHIGFDAIDDGCGYVRRNMKWEKTINNMKTILSECPHVKITITTTFMWLNTINAIRMLEWFNENFPNLKATINYVIHEHLDIRIAPKELKQDMINNLQRLYSLNNTDNHMVDNLINYIQSKDLSHKWESSLEWVKKEDEWNNDSFLMAFPELEKYL